MSENKYDLVTKSRKTIITNNFLGGLAWGVGVTLGLTILFGIIAFVSSHINFVPIVGEFVSKVLNYVLTNRVR